MEGHVIDSGQLALGLELLVQNLPHCGVAPLYEQLSEHRSTAIFHPVRRRGFVMDMISRHTLEQQIIEIWSRDNLFLAPGAFLVHVNLINTQYDGRTF